MTAPVHRRGLLALLGAGSAAAAAGASPAALASGRLRAGFAGGAARHVGLMRLADEVDRIAPLAQDAPAALLRISAALDSAGAPARRAAELRALAALAPAYPPEIAAPRAFGAAMRRRLYAELLARESERIAAAGAPPPPPPASPGPDA